MTTVRAEELRTTGGSSSLVSEVFTSCPELLSTLRDSRVLCCTLPARPTPIPHPLLIWLALTSQILDSFSSVKWKCDHLSGRAAYRRVRGNFVTYLRGSQPLKRSINSSYYRYCKLMFFILGLCTMLQLQIFHTLA